MQLASSSPSKVRFAVAVHAALVCIWVGMKAMSKSKYMVAIIWVVGKKEVYVPSVTRDD